MDRHNIRNATPLFCSGDNGKSTVGLGPSDVVVNQPDAVGVCEANIPCSDQIQVVYRKPVDKIRIPVQSEVRQSHVGAMQTTPNPIDDDEIQHTE